MSSIASQSVPTQMNGRRRQKRRRHGNISNNNVSDTEGLPSSHARDYPNNPQKHQPPYVNTRTSQQSNTPTSSSQTGTPRQGHFFRPHAGTRKASTITLTNPTKVTHPRIPKHY